jgi:chemotaxis protein histidine kinase CheA
MEQLVHLRLKSIYKAFKNSSPVTRATAAIAGGARKNDRLLLSEDATDMGASPDDAEALMMAAAAASALAAPMKTATKKKTPANNVFDENPSMEEYQAELDRAEAAAAALLAELEEEEQAVQSKKSKKKKKKVRQQAKRDEDTKVEESTSPVPDDYPLSSSDHEENAAAAPLSKQNSDLMDSIADETRARVDPLEEEFEELTKYEDLEGLGNLLASVKGVPGKAILRKNIKKALKRLRAPVEAEEENEQADPSLPRFTPVSERVTSPTHELRAETPVQTEGDIRIAELLKVVSHTHNKIPTSGARSKTQSSSGKSECIMHMQPVIVGWVIGKGGQRIRDLMEESGSKIWIDQDSMEPQEPRIVYVSGHRKNVDLAVRMIKDLIARAPAETPQSRQSTPAAESSPSKGFPVSSGGKGPGLPKDFASGDGFQLKPRDSATNGYGTPKTKHELTCDARFVPLLIGRRGWTVKNIQDASGARIDIDQTVTPRKITITGSASSVEIAKSMVGDVLSYPQSQLHGTTENGEPEDVNVQPQETAETRQETKEEPNAPSTSYHGEGSPHSPPPSSLIVTGDGKSTISASSSLSSTPEPSMAPTKAASHALPSGPLLPPVAHGGGLYAQSLPNPLGPFQPNSLPVHNNPFSQDGMGGVNRGTLAPGSPSGAFPPPNPSPSFGGTAVGGRVPLFPSAGLDGQPFVGGGSTPTSFPTDQSPTLSTSAFRNAHHANLAPTTSPIVNRPIMANAGVPNDLPGIWNPSTDKPPPARSAAATPQGRGGYGLAAAVDFLQHSNHARPVDLSRPAPAGAGLPPAGGTYGLPPQPPMTQSPSGMFGESTIVDSLFGPLGASNNSQAGLISGLTGLGLGPPVVEGSSIWGDGSGLQGDKMQDFMGLNSLLSDSQEQQQHQQQHQQQQQHPVGGFEKDHSRFAWGGP